MKFALFLYLFTKSYNEYSLRDSLTPFGLTTPTHLLPLSLYRKAASQFQQYYLESTKTNQHSYIIKMI